jgi:hypothetical protein
MSYTRDMLDSAPTPLTLDAALLTTAIDACAATAQACTACADASLNEDDVAELSRCVALCVNCADLCTVSVRVLSRRAREDTFLLARLLQACVRACEASAAECARHAAHHRQCAVCETACRSCEEAMKRLLGAEALQELEALAD